MNERDTFNNSNIEMPKYRVDNSNEKIGNLTDYKQELPKKQEEKQIAINFADEKKEEKNEYQSGISKTKIININDFIFRQYLEFYPELKGLSCKDNTLYLQENDNIVASETLTFDLRTLPGEAWNVDARKFMDIIKLNKECSKLDDFIKLLTEDYFVEG